jgi:long-chain acyl-CoA synthetase
MKTLQDLVSSLEHKEGVAISWNELIKYKDKNGKDAQKNELQQVTFKELYDTINSYSKGLIELGLKKGDSVAIISGNNPQWINLSLGTNNAGLIDVPINEASKPKELENILVHSKPKIIIIEDNKVLNNIDTKNHPEIEHIFSIKNIEGIKNISDLKKLGENSGARLFNASPDDIAGRLYTSGTTGSPKGVQLSHSNLISNIIALQNMLHLDAATDKGFSILPAWHSFERGHKNLLAYTGVEAFYSNKSTLMNDLKEQKPTMLVLVPRILEKVREKVIDTLTEKKVIGIFTKLYPLSLDYHKRDLDLKKILEYAPYKIEDALFFSKVRDVFGGKVRYLVTGSSSLSKHVEDFFVAAGIDVLEGYGMTETSPVISARRPGKKMYYSVGIPLDDVEVKIVSLETDKTLPQGLEGLIHVKGPNVMKGYYNNEEETKKVLSGDGWLNTGDLGYLNPNQTLKITGRFKELIKLSNGEYINPVLLEDALASSEYIDTAVIIGDDSWKRLGALILPNFEKLKEYYKKVGKEYNHESPMHNLIDPSTGEKRPEIDKLYSDNIDEFVNKNQNFKPNEHIRHFAFIEELRPEVLTNTLKIMRRKMKETYRDTIEYLDKKIRGDKSTGSV